ncbi:protein kinase family protein [Streptococcus sp. ZJ93]|uniref:class III lanthionine synthetase LanKC N-terminal domain-containing protein n=1 Tax=Streptococcus handemini TaxID=3161188 RepID=UPI0032EFA407
MFKMVNLEKAHPVVHGFKIHLSATKDNYKELFQLIYPVLIQADVTFKYIEKEEDVLFNFSECETPASSGKYFTIYPNSQEHCLELLEMLYGLIPTEMDGIYILSDRSYKDSHVIFYRYGFFEDNEEYLVKGIPTLVGPNGEVWQDYQKGYFDLPSWIEDIQVPNIIQESYLSEHYTVTDMICRKNGGNIYSAIRKSDGLEVVMKETRPNIVVLDDIDKKMLRENEYKHSLLLATSPYTPNPIEDVQEWINHYYIYERVSGENLLDYSSSYSMFSFDSSKPEENRQKFQKFLQIGWKLVSLVEYFHKHNIVLNDIHAQNFLVTATNQLYFIDLENSYQNVEDNMVGIFHDISLREWNDLDGKVADCHKVGNLLLYLLGRLHIKSGEAYKPSLTKELLLRYGIDSDFSGFIEELFSDQVTISNVVENWSRISVQPSRAVFSLDLTMFDKIREKVEPIIHLNREQLAPYLTSSVQQGSLKKWIDRERNFGLDGLSGVLLLMHYGEIDAELSGYIIDKIQNSLVQTEYGVAVPYGETCASPYLHTGTAGFIRALLTIDATQYQSLIYQLMEALLVEFGQYSAYLDGMLGVTDVLIDLYQLFQEKRIRQMIELQLMNVAIKAKYDLRLQSQLIYVLSRYRSMTHDIILEKQVV